jgi:hypothetical protein
MHTPDFNSYVWVARYSQKKERKTRRALGSINCGEWFPRTHSPAPKGLRKGEPDDRSMKTLKCGASRRKRE